MDSRLVKIKINKDIARQALANSIFTVCFSSKNKPRSLTGCVVFLFPRVAEKLVKMKLKFLTPHRLSVTLPILDCAFFDDQGACYRAENVLGIKFKGTILTILEDNSIPAMDRIWAATREGAMPSELQRLCAVAVILNTKTPKGNLYDLIQDERSKNAVHVAEQNAHGRVGDYARATARAAAWTAAWAAIRAAARAADRDSAWAAAWDAMPLIFADAIRQNLKNQ